MSLPGGFERRSSLFWELLRVEESLSRLKMTDLFLFVLFDFSCLQISFFPGDDLPWSPFTPVVSLEAFLCPADPRGFEIVHPFRPSKHLMGRHLFFITVFYPLPPLIFFILEGVLFSGGSALVLVPVKDCFATLHPFFSFFSLHRLFFSLSIFLWIMNVLLLFSILRFPY